MDRFLEESVTKKNRGMDEVMYYMSWVCIVLTGLYGLSMLMALPTGFTVLGLVVTLAALGVCALIYFKKDTLRTEYDYTFTNGSLDFAMVFNNRKRKSLGSVNVAKVDAFGKVQSGSFNRHVQTPGIKQLRWFLNRGAELYYMVISKDGKKSIIVFEPSEEMVGYIRHYLPFGAAQEN